MSDQKNLTKFSRDKKAWPVYMTIGNLPSTIRYRPGSMAILLLRQLPILPKLAKSSWANKPLGLINADTLSGVFELIFAPLHGAAQEGAPIDCGDGKIQRYFPIILYVLSSLSQTRISKIRSDKPLVRKPTPRSISYHITKRQPTMQPKINALQHTNSRAKQWKLFFLIECTLIPSTLYSPPAAHLHAWYTSLNRCLKTTFRLHSHQPGMFYATRKTLIHQL